MAWRVARSLDQLLAQLNALAPNRSRVSDGSIGDEAHRAEGSASDHNPWFVLNGQELVTARDFTHDPANGLDCDKLAAWLIASRDPRIKYLIWRGRICDSRPQFNPWTWQPSSGHFQHLHLSVMANASADDARPWALGATEDDMSADAERKIGYINDALGGAYENTPNGEVTIGTRVKDMDRRLGYVEKALGDAYDPATDTTIGDRVKNIEAAAERLEKSGVPVDVRLSDEDVTRIATRFADLVDARARDNNPNTGPVS